MNNGTCNDDIGEYNCTCSGGWTGKDCISGEWQRFILSYFLKRQPGYENAVGP